MSKLSKLKNIKTRKGLAKLLGFSHKSFSYILYAIPDEKKYTEFFILKKNGGERVINAPINKLKLLQKRLAEILNICFDEIYNKNNKSLSHGFRKEHSIITNAKDHKNKRYVLNFDLKDFFPSINFGRVQGFFIKNKHFKLDKKIVTIISQIVCHEKKLPQGSPYSPIISNFIGHILDIRMVNLAKKTKCTYSRYADDLTFSTNQKKFPPKIAIQDNNKWLISDYLKKEIEKVNFSINESKTSMQYKTGRQVTTGLIVNKILNIKKEYYKKARAMCNLLFQTDRFYINKIINEPEISKDDTEEFEPITEIEGSLIQLEGILSFIYKIKRLNYVEKTNTRRYYPNAITKLYREFLFYKHFFSLDMPLVICEGKTDKVYIKCALEVFIANTMNLLK